MTSSSDADTGLRALAGPGHDGRSLGGDDLSEVYAWPAAGAWVRAMMVTTLDGAACGPDGLSGSVSSSVDRRVLGEVRRFADAVLIGAGTLRGERYGPMRSAREDTRDRLAAGRREAPVIAVVSASVDLPWELPVWSDSTHRPLVITDGSAARDRMELAHRYADVVVLAELNPVAIVDALVARGLDRIVCEGGPRLLRDLVAAGVIDEADITFSPMFVGTAASPTTPSLPAPVRGELMSVLTGDGFIMARYRMGR